MNVFNFAHFIWQKICIINYIINKYIVNKDVYLFDLPAYSIFSNMNDEDKKDQRRQYNELMKRINGIN